MNNIAAIYCSEQCGFGSYRVSCKTQYHRREITVVSIEHKEYFSRPWFCVNFLDGDSLLVNPRHVVTVDVGKYDN